MAQGSVDFEFMDDHFDFNSPAYLFQPENTDKKLHIFEE